MTDHAYSDEQEPIPPSITLGDAVTRAVNTMSGFEALGFAASTAAQTMFDELKKAQAVRLDTLNEALGLNILQGYADELQAARQALAHVVTPSIPAEVWKQAQQDWIADLKATSSGMSNFSRLAAIVQATQRNTFTLDAVTAATQRKAFTLDAVVAGAAPVDDATPSNSAGRTEAPDLTATVAPTVASESWSDYQRAMFALGLIQVLLTMAAIAPHLWDDYARPMIWLLEQVLTSR